MSPVVFNNFARIADDLQSKGRAVLLKTALDAEALAQEASRVDTGAMRSGWMLAPGNSQWELRLVNAQHYAIYHEYGFHLRDGTYMHEQPMLHPALDAVRAPFLMALAQVLR